MQNAMATHLVERFDWLSLKIKKNRFVRPFPVFIPFDWTHLVRRPASVLASMTILRKFHLIWAFHYSFGLHCLRSLPRLQVLHGSLLTVLTALSLNYSLCPLRLARFYPRSRSFSVWRPFGCFAIKRIEDLLRQHPIYCCRSVQASNWQWVAEVAAVLPF